MKKKRTSYASGSKTKQRSFSETQNAVYAIQERMNWYTVAITANGKLHQGAGTLIKIKGITFVLTCRHIVEPFLDQELRFLYRGPTPLQYLDSPDKLKAEILDLKKCGTIIEIEVKNRVVSDQTKDLAVLEISSSCQNLEFYEFPQKQILCRAGRVVYLTGFPAQNNRYWRGEDGIEVGVFPHSYFGKISKIKKSLENFESGTHFLIEELDNSEGRRVDPRGLSGACVWSRLPSRIGIWSANICLVGVQQSAYKSLSLLKATRGTKVTQFLRTSLKL